MNDGERNYSVSEVEFFAIMEALNNVQTNLLYQKSNKHMYYVASQWLGTIYDRSGWSMKWYLELTEFLFEVIYMQSRKILLADELWHVLRNIETVREDTDGELYTLAILSLDKRDKLLKDADKKIKNWTY